MARSVEELRSWAVLLKLCQDDCQVIRTTKTMRSAVLEVDRELGRLHQVESAALELARMFDRIRKSGDDDFEIMEELWNREEVLSNKIIEMAIARKFDHVEVTND